MRPYYVLLDHPLQFAAYLILITALISLWVYKKVWVYLPLAIISLAFALYGGIVEFTILIPFLFLGTALTILRLNISGYIRLFLVTIAAVSAFALFSQMVKGTHNLLLFSGTVKQGSAPYSLYWRYGKGMVGLLILGIVHPLISDPMHWKLTLKRSIIWGILTIAALLGMSYGLDLIRFDLAVPAFLPLWLIANLFFVSIAEEALFRGLLQRELTDVLPQRWGWIASILITSTIFVLAHLFFTFDVRYLLLAFGAGLFYGLTYSITGAIEASIFVHFLVNATHIIFFSYPYLTGSL